jgi:hypothetical protein
MPCKSVCKSAVEELQAIATEAQEQFLAQVFLSDQSDSSTDSDLDQLMITPPSPLSPVSGYSSSYSTDEDGSSGSSTSEYYKIIQAHYNLFFNLLIAAENEIINTRVLHRPSEPPM